MIDENTLLPEEERLDEPLPWEEEAEEPEKEEKDERQVLPKNTEEKEESTVSFEEAPASATIKVKTDKGFVVMFTMRDASAKTLMFKIRAMTDNWLKYNWTPVEERSGGFAKKAPVEKNWIPNRTCPVDGGRLYASTTKNGKKNIQCENRKWNSFKNQAEGCTFIEWQDDYQNR